MDVKTQFVYTLWMVYNYVLPKKWIISIHKMSLSVILKHGFIIVLKFLKFLFVWIWYLIIY